MNVRVAEGDGFLAGANRPRFFFSHLPGPAGRRVGRLVQPAAHAVGRRIDHRGDELGGDGRSLVAHDAPPRSWSPTHWASGSGLTAATAIPALTTAAALPVW